jgi:hypothetical protein
LESRIFCGFDVQSNLITIITIAITNLEKEQQSNLIVLGNDEMQSVIGSDVPRPNTVFQAVGA